MPLDQNKHYLGPILGERGGKPVVAATECPCVGEFTNTCNGCPDAAPDIWFFEVGNFLPTNTCDQCPGGASSTWQVTLSFTGNCSVFNGAHNMAQVSSSPCKWEVVEGGNRYTLEYIAATDVFRLTITDQATLSVVYEKAASLWNCIGINSMSLVSSGCVPAPPGTVSVIPIDGCAQYNGFHILEIDLTGANCRWVEGAIVLDYDPVLDRFCLHLGGLLYCLSRASFDCQKCNTLIRQNTIPGCSAPDSITICPDGDQVSTAQVKIGGHMVGLLMGVRNGKPIYATPCNQRQADGRLIRGKHYLGRLVGVRNGKPVYAVGWGQHECPDVPGYGYDYGIYEGGGGTTSGCVHCIVAPMRYRLIASGIQNAKCGGGVIDSNCQPLNGTWILHYRGGGGLGWGCCWSTNEIVELCPNLRRNAWILQLQGVVGGPTFGNCPPPTHNMWAMGYGACFFDLGAAGWYTAAVPMDGCMDARTLTNCNLAFEPVDYCNNPASVTVEPA